MKPVTFKNPVFPSLGRRKFGGLAFFAGRHSNLPEFLLKIAMAKEGSAARFPFGFKTVFLVKSPALITYILQDNFRNYVKSSRIERIKPLFGEGLTTSEGDLWRCQRPLLQSVFRSHPLPALSKAVHRFTAEMLDRWKGVEAVKGRIDILKEMTSLTRRIILSVLFGSEAERRGPVLGKAMAIVLEGINNRVWNAFRWWNTFPLSRERSFKKALRVLDDFTYEAIARRRREEEKPSDLLSLLLRVRDENSGKGMTPKQVRDEVMTLLAAGHSTVAVALTWILYLLSRNPHVESKLSHELDRGLGTLKSSPAATDDSSFLRKVLDEGLRLYPPTWVTARTPLERDRFKDVAFPAGSIILISPYVMHRLPEFWENPERFNPERFNGHRQGKRPSGVYIPFGFGPRRCLGKGFALMEMKWIIAMIAQRFHLQLPDQKPVLPRAGITLQPHSPIRMIPRERKV